MRVETSLHTTGTPFMMILTASGIEGTNFFSQKFGNIKKKFSSLHRK